MIKNFYNRDVTCFWPLPPVTNCHTFSDPLERDVLYGRLLWRANKRICSPFMTSSRALLILTDGRQHWSFRQYLLLTSTTDQRNKQAIYYRCFYPCYVMQKWYVIAIIWINEYDWSVINAWPSVTTTVTSLEVIDLSTFFNINIIL